MNKKFGLALLLVALMIVVSACGDEEYAPRPESDSPQAYSIKDDVRVKVDDGLYTITGTVAGDVDSLTRQTQAAQGSIAGSGFGFYGTYFGPEFGGKGFVRLFVESSDSALALAGEVVILKTTDTKAIVLIPGDRVTFKCRAQYEAVAPVREYETFDETKRDLVETWELDYCRLAVPLINIGQ